MKDFYDLFVKELKHIYSAENQLVIALPKLIHAAHSTELKAAIRHHLKETKQQVKRLDAIANELGINIQGGKSDGLAGILKDGSKALRFHLEPAARDAAIIFNAQRIEHFEIASYGNLKAMAKSLDLAYVEKLLNATSEEESNANKKLNQIAKGTFFHSGINKTAYQRLAA